MTIVGCDLYDSQQRYLATFSTRQAAFEAMNRLHDDSYRPIGLVSHLTPLDVRAMGRIRAQGAAWPTTR